MVIQKLTKQPVTAGGLIASAAAGALTGGVSSLSPILLNMGLRGAGQLATKAALGAVVGQQTAMLELVIDNDARPEAASSIPAAGITNAVAAVLPGGTWSASTLRGITSGAGFSIAEGVVEEVAGNFLEDLIDGAQLWR